MITLLNGEQFEEKELLEKMQDDIFYYGHLGKNALSKSAFSDLLKSPRTYRNKIFKETNYFTVHPGFFFELGDTSSRHSRYWLNGKPR